MNPSTPTPVTTPIPIAQPAQPTIIPTKTLLYYRKIYHFKGVIAIPAILRLDADGTLTFKDNDGEGFSVPISQLSVKFSAWGTMTLRVAGKKYSFTGNGAMLSPKISSDLGKELLPNDPAEANSQQNLSGAVGTTVFGASLASFGGAVGSSVLQEAGAVTTVVGATTMELAYYEGLAAMKQWESIFISAGLPIKKRHMRAMLYWVLIIIFVLFVAPFLISGLATLFHV